jgi:hypothetical protein
MSNRGTTFAAVLSRAFQALVLCPTLYRSSLGKRNVSDRSCEVAFQSWLSRLSHKCLPRVQSFLKVIAARVSCYKESQSQLAGYRDIPP